MSFLGFLLKNGALFPRKDHLQAFDAMPYPANKDQLCSAMCMLRHYRIFCKGFSQIGQCLYNLLKQNVRWNWMPAYASAFDQLRRMIAQGKLLCYDIHKPLFIMADALVWALFSPMMRSSRRLFGWAVGCCHSLRQTTVISSVKCWQWWKLSNSSTSSLLAILLQSSLIIIRCSTFLLQVRFQIMSLFDCSSGPLLCEPMITK